MYDVMLTVGVGFNNSQIARQVALASSQIQRGLSQQPLGRITGQANEFQKSLEASNARVVAFGASAGAIYAVRAAFQKLLSSTVEVERSLTEINNLLNLGEGDLSRFGSSLFRIANGVSVSFSDAAKVAQEFSRQGLGVEETLKRTNSALILTKLSTIPVEDAVSSLTATMNAFTKEALTDIDIVNRFANVDAKFAVSTGDLAEAFKRVGSSAADAGVSFNEMVALVTAAQQATARGGSVIGNSFKTIFTRLQRPQVLDDLENAGIKVRDLSGKAIPLIDVLKNLSSTYDTLASSQKSFVSETVGGVYQINILKSILNDLGSGLSIYKGALDAAGNSTATADLRIQALNKTISSQLVRTVNDLTQASAAIGKIVFEPSIRGGLGAFDGLVKRISGGLNENNEGIGSTLFKGIASGLGNALSGPGIQFAIFALIKLFQRLSNFIVDSFKDLTGVNEKIKERAAIEQAVIKYMSTQENLLQNLRSGVETIDGVHAQILQKIQEENFAMHETSIYAKEISNALAKNVSIQKNPISQNLSGRNAASGFVPNLSSMALKEFMGARMGGYNSGSIVSTSISNGSGISSIIANSAETKSGITIGGKTYEWINPPRNSSAGMKHERNSQIKTGINPYELRQFGLYSRGFVPNLFSMFENVGEALERENRATGGNGILSRSKDLVSAQNPLGLVAIDRRNQKNAGDAIIQHKMLGQTMSQIKNMSTASSGSVPNLALDASNAILLSGILGLAQNIKDIGGITDTLGGFKNALGSLFTFMDAAARKESLWIDSKVKSIQANREWIRSVESARQELLKNPGKQIDFGGTKYSLAADFEKAVGPLVQTAQKDIKEFTERQAAQSRRIQKVGFAASIGGSVAGGVASQFLGRVSPDAAAASDEFFNGIQTAGQILTVFQGQLAKTASLFFVVNGAVNAVSTFASGIEGAKRNLEIQQNQSQKLIAGLDAVNLSLSNMNGMLLDSSVTLEALNKEQKKYQDALATIGSSSREGSRIASSIQTSPDNLTKISLINQAKELEGKKINELAALFQIKELGAERGLPNFLGGAKFSGGIFGAGNEADKAKSLAVLQNNANNIFSSLDEGQKGALIKNLSNREKFQNVLSNNETYSTVSEAIKENRGTAFDNTLLVEQLRLLVVQIAAIKDPLVSAARKNALDRNAKAQLNVDLAIKNETAFKRLFLNAGAIQSENELDKAKIGPNGFKTLYNESLVRDAAEKAKNNLIGFQYSAKTLAAHEYATDIQKVDTEREFKIGTLRDQTSRSIIAAYSQNVDTLGKTSDTGESSTITGQNIPRIGPFSESIVTALNKGLTAVTKEGSLDRFIGNNGFDFDSFEQAVITNGKGTEETNIGLKNYLSQNRGTIDFLKLIQSNNNELVEINSDALREARIHTEKFNALKAELSLRSQANFLGGVGALNDRNIERRITRDLTRGGRLLDDRSLNTEARARGASQFLTALRDSGFEPLRIARREGNRFIPVQNDAQSQRVARALNLVVAGTSIVQNRITRSVGNALGRNGDASLLFGNSINNPLARDAAAVSVANAFRPEGADIISNAGAINNLATERINESLRLTSNRVIEFGEVLLNVKKNLEEAIKNRETKQTEQSQAIKLGNKEFEKSQKTFKAGLGGAPTDQRNISDLIPKSSNVKGIADTGLSAAITGGIVTYLALRSPEAIKNTVGKLKNIGGFIKDKGGKITGSITSGLKSGGSQTLKTIGGGIGGTLTGLAGYGIGSTLAEKVTGDTSGISGIIGGSLASVGLTTGLARALPTLSTVGAAAINPLLIAATALGGFKGGNSLYRAFNNKSFSGIKEGSESANENLKNSIIQDFRKGKSSNEARERILAQIKTDKESLNEIGGDSIFGKVKRFGWGLGKEADIINKSIESNEKLLQGLEALRLAVVEEKNNEGFQEKLLAAISNTSKGKEGAENITPINVEISLKDVDKLPDIFSNKIIQPLIEQLKTLQNRASNIESRIGIGPQPSTIS